jgi:hypothetical protein
MDPLKIKLNMYLEEEQTIMINQRFKYENYNKIKRDLQNTLNAKKIVSEIMKNKFQKSISENLENNKQIKYIDCSQRWDQNVICMIIKDLDEDINWLDDIGEDFELSLEELERIMKEKNIKSMYVYLDNIEYLRIQEQKNINRIIFDRWSIWHDCRLYLKINNMGDDRRTWKAITGRIQSPHDYSDKYIDEEEI